jgi:hypothetical protein
MNVLSKPVPDIQGFPLMTQGNGILIQRGLSHVINELFVTFSANYNFFLTESKTANDSMPSQNKKACPIEWICRLISDLYQQTLTTLNTLPGRRC